MKLLNKLLDSDLFLILITILLAALILPPIFIIVYKTVIFFGSLYIDYLSFIGIELPDDTH